MKEQTLPADAAALPAEPTTRARRRVPALVLGLGGAVLAIGYGVLAMHMRFGPPLVVLGLGGLTLVLSGVALWRVLDPLSRADLASLTVAPRSSGRLKELEREKQLVLKAIKEVEFDYQMRKIAEPDYKDMMERYRTRALRIIGELEAGDNFRPLIERELRDRLAAMEGAARAGDGAARAGDGAARAGDGAARAGDGAARAGEGGALAGAVPEAGLCGSCGTRNDEDAQFCKKCGGKLGTS